MQALSILSDLPHADVEPGQGSPTSGRQ
jgi:hypothetical protein